MCVVLSGIMFSCRSIKQPFDLPKVNKVAETESRLLDEKAANFINFMAYLAKLVIDFFNQKLTKNIFMAKVMSAVFVIMTNHPYHLLYNSVYYCVV